MKNSTTKFTFKKAETLKSKTLIKELFSNGSYFYLYPFKVLYAKLPLLEYTEHQVMFTVPKRVFKRAVDRNRLKRLMRECYRLNKQIIHESELNTLCIAYIYTAKEIMAFNTIQPKLQQSLQRLNKNMHKKHNDQLEKNNKN